MGGFTILGSYSYVLNLAAFSNPFGSGGLAGAVLTDLSPRSFPDNLIKVGLDGIDLYPIYSDVTRESRALQTIARSREKGSAVVMEALGVNPRGGRFVFTGRSRFATDEDTAGFGLLGVAVLLPAVCFGLASKDRLVRLYAAGVVLCLLVIVYVIARQPYFSRFLVLPALLSTPLTGRFAGSVFGWFAIVSLAVPSLLSVVLLNEQKPLLSVAGRKSLFTMSREATRYLGNAATESFGRMNILDNLTPVEKAIALRANLCVYPFRGPAVLPTS